MSVGSVVFLTTFLALANAVDLKRRRIPNWLTMPALGLGFVGALCGWWPWSWGGMLGAMVLLKLSGVGMGDVKACAVVGGLSGWLIVPALIITLSVLWMVWHGWERMWFTRYPGDWPFMPWLTVGLYGTLVVTWYLH